MPVLFRRWDRDADGTIDETELMQLSQYVQERMPRGARAGVRHVPRRGLLAELSPTALCAPSVPQSWLRLIASLMNPGRVVYM